MIVIDLNADVGEWDAVLPAAEIALMSVISSANVACGVHAGSEDVIARTVELALAHGVAVGAHPSFDDREHFGRREMAITPAEVATLLWRQLGVIAEVAARQNVVLQHVKPHGALYNMAARDPALADAVASTVAAFDPSLVLFGLAGSELIAAGGRAGLRTAAEVFADRGYRADGSLAPRSVPGAVIEDADTVGARAVEMVISQTVLALDGTRIGVAAQTLCVHGDTPGAAILARRVREALEAAGVQISAIR